MARSDPHRASAAHRRSPPRRAALEVVARRQAQLLEQLAEQGVDAGARSTGYLHLREEQEWDGQQERMLHRGHRATTRVELRLYDAGVAAHLVHGMVSLAEVCRSKWAIVLGWGGSWRSDRPRGGQAEPDAS